MTDAYPRIRSDLEIRPESDDPASGVIVKDPIRRRFYRFTPVQAGVLRALDGTRSAEAVARHVSEQYRTSVESAQVGDFAEKLRGLLLLDDPSCWTRLQLESGPKRGFVRSLLQIKLHAFNPEALLTRLERRLRFLFSAGFGILAGISFCVSVFLTILNWEALSASVGSLLSLYSIPLILAVVFAVMTIHEFAHGITLKHFGGRAEEMGVMLLYFIPAFYCNVSDAWMLPKKQRILVTLAGGYAQLCIWAWATVAWRLLAPETFLSSLFAVTIAFSGIQTVFNFMPLIRLDGYYLLSDWLEIPNLRARSFRHLKSSLSRWLLGDGDEASVAPARQKRIYLLYGISSLVFSAGLAWFMIDRLGGWLVREYQAWGLVLVLAIILMVVPAPGKGNVKSSGRFAGKVVVRIQKTPLLVLLLLVLLVSAFLPWELKVSGDFTILPKNKVTINPEIEGTLKAIHVDEGDRVKTGGVLAEMRNLELENSYEETKGELASKTASLELLKAGSRPEEIERAVRLVETRRAELANVTRVQQERAVLQEAVARKEAELDNAYKNYERSKRLLADGLIARNEVERDETTYAVRQKELSEALGQLKVLDERIERTRDVKRKELAEAESELKILRAGSRKEAIQAVEAEVTKLQEKLRILARQVEQLTIRSPMDGIVATPYLRNRIGEYLQAGSVLCEIVSSGSVIVDMPVPEKEIADVKLGYPIVLKVRGFPQLTFGARVRSISPVAVDRGLERKVVVQGELDNPEEILRAGMTGVGKILCGKRMIGDLLTRRVIRWLRTEFWEYLP